MQKSGILTAVILGLFAQPALACDLKELPLGASAGTVADKFDVEISGGEVQHADVRARAFCEKLPPEAEMRLTFVKDSLVTIDIASFKGQGELLALAEAAYGKAENRPEEGNPQHKAFHQNWLVGEDGVALYTVTKSGDALKEHLQLSSKEGAAKLGEAKAAREKAAVKGGR